MKDKLPLADGRSYVGGSADLQITADRLELKYVLAPEHARGLLDAVTRYLPPHLPPRAFPGVDSLPAGGLEQRITTVYLDTASRDIYWTCLAGDVDERLRIKEYRPGDRPHELPDIAWMEIKKSAGVRSKKDRIPVSGPAIQAALDQGSLSLATILAAADPDDSEAHALLQRLWCVQRRHRRPLRATCVVTYGRRAWQDHAGELRITVDQDLRVRRPGPAQEASSALLYPEMASREGAAMIVEVKHRRELPGWLEERLGGLVPARLPGHPARPFSKFLAASDAVLSL